MHLMLGKTIWGTFATFFQEASLKTVTYFLVQVLNVRTQILLSSEGCSLMGAWWENALLYAVFGCHDLDTVVRLPGLCAAWRLAIGYAPLSQNHSTWTGALKHYWPPGEGGQFSNCLSCARIQSSCILTLQTAFFTVMQYFCLSVQHRAEHSGEQPMSQAYASGFGMRAQVLKLLKPRCSHFS